jgi:uncharacterized ferredoxin-like protein
VVVVTAVFANLARTAARARGIDPIPMLVLPHPMETRPAAEIDRICEERFEEAIGLISERSIAE